MHFRLCSLAPAVLAMAAACASSTSGIPGEGAGLSGTGRDAGTSAASSSGGGSSGADIDASAGLSNDAEVSSSVVDGAVSASADGPTSKAVGEGGANCGTSLLAVPSDPGVRGPWKVGVRTVTIGRLTVEVTYPALPGSEAGKSIATYDVRDWLPGTEAKKVSDSQVPAVTPLGGDYYRDLPIDAAHGPYPVILNIHGTASFRVANGTLLAQWASRGFVVLSADYPGLGLHDMLASTIDCNLPTNGMQDVPTDVNTQLTALMSPSGDVAFLAGHIDTSRLGITGHSQGACDTAGFSTLPNVQVVVPMAGSVAVKTSTTLKGLMFIAGMADQVIGYNTPLGTIGNVVCTSQGMLAQSDTGAYNASPGPPAVKKRLVGITGGGHLVPTDLCQTNSMGQNAIQVAKADNVCGVNDAVIIGLPALFDCGTIDWKIGLHDVAYASTAAFEEVLMCRDHSAEFASLKTNLPNVGDFQAMP